MIARRAAAGAVLLAWSSGCTGAGKSEAVSLTTAVDRFLHAPPEATEAQARAVSAVACTDERVCAAKQLCVAAIEPTAKAIVLKDEVGQRLADLEARRLAPDSGEAEALPSKLDDASRLLSDGHKKMVACEGALADLQVAYHL